MPGDYSRFTFKRKNRYSRVLKQQGRVTLDSDHNEQSEILTHRDRTFARDAVGDSAVPRATTPDAFKITAVGPDLHIEPGRIYVDGVMAEAFPSDPLTYANQPFYPHPPSLTGVGRGLAYLDVWERELTAVQEPALLEPALRGIDTTTRWQTMWQVKIAPKSIFPTVKCGIDLDTIFPPTPPPLLTVHVDLPGEEPDPCALPEAGGFRGVENHHYRVEIHGTTTPKIKFSRDSVSARIEEIKPGPAGPTPQTILKVVRTGRDSVLRFSEGDRVEVLNESRVLGNELGTMALVVKVDDALREITIDKAIAPAPSTPDPRAWITKWDGGLLDVTAGEIALENGISIKLTGGPPLHGYYWMFPAREATHTAGPLVNEPPHGPIHHYTPLAMIDGLGTTEPTVVSDCRTLWPPDCDCECASCVNPEDHRSERWTIQMAIDKVSREGGGKICLKPGSYVFEQPLVIADTADLKLTGHGDCNLLFVGDAPQALLIERSDNIVIEDLELTRIARFETESTLVIIRNSYYGTVIRNCTLWAPNAEGGRMDGIAVALEGLVRDAKILDCRITAPVGIGPILDSQGKSRLVVGEVEIRGNTIEASDGAIRFLARNVAANIRQNKIRAGTSGIRVEGMTRTGRSNIIDSNSVETRRGGIGVGADRTTVSNNLVHSTFRLNPSASTLVHADQTYSSIAVYGGVSDVRKDCLVTGNRCRNTLGMGVLVADPVEALIIEKNFIRHTAAAGIGTLDKASGSNLTIEGNDIREVGLGKDDSNHFFGIRLAPGCDADVLENTIIGVGPTGNDKWPTFPANGIRADSPRRVRIHENTISDVKAAPEMTAQGRFSIFASAAIYVVPPLGVVEITNNTVYTAGVAYTADVATNFASVPNGHVYAIRIQAPLTYDYTVFTMNADIANATSAVSAATKTAVKKGTRKAAKTTARAVGNDGPAIDPRLPRGVYERYAVAFPGNYWIGLGVATSLVLIRANVVECAGSVDPEQGMVRVEGASLRCTFGGNICAHRFAGDQLLGFGVRLSAETVVADSNQIFGNFVSKPQPSTTTAQSFAFEALIILSQHWTALGNIVQGDILLGASVLPKPSVLEPWRLLLNRQDV